MMDGYLEKTPTEKKTYDADFAAELPSGDSIKPKAPGNQTNAVVVDSTGFDVTQTLVESVLISGSRVQVKLIGGVSGMDYHMKVTADMYSAGTIFQKFFEIRVRASRRTF